MSEKVGAGILVNPSLLPAIDQILSLVEFAPVIPDRLWNSTDRNGGYRYLPKAWEMIKHIGERVQLPLHGIGLSIGSAGPVDPAYLDALFMTAAALKSPWISDHLSFVNLHEHGDLSPAAALPVPYDLESLDFLSCKVEAIVRSSPVPFLLENPAYYFEYPGQTYSEPHFLSELCNRTGAGILLDLHNLVCNIRNFKWDAQQYLDDLDWSRVLEIHVAGGSEMHGFWTDSHTGQVDSAVWGLLPMVLERASLARCVTFEFHEASYPEIGQSGLSAELTKIRQAIELVAQRTPAVALA